MKYKVGDLVLLKANWVFLNKEDEIGLIIKIDDEFAVYKIYSTYNDKVEWIDESTVKKIQ